MSFLTAFFNQSATWWRKTGINENGEPTFAAPKVLKVRWEDRTDQVMGNEGDIVISQSRVFVDRDMVAGDYLALGVVPGVNPRKIPGAFPVAHQRRIPDLAGVDFERTSYLSGGTAP